MPSHHRLSLSFLPSYVPSPSLPPSQTRTFSLADSEKNNPHNERKMLNADDEARISASQCTVQLRGFPRPSPIRIITRKISHRNGLTMGQEGSGRHPEGKHCKGEVRRWIRWRGRTRSRSPREGALCVGTVAGKRLVFVCLFVRMIV